MEETILHLSLACLLVCEYADLSAEGLELAGKKKKKKWGIWNLTSEFYDADEGVIS